MDILEKSFQETFGSCKGSITSALEHVSFKVCLAKCLGVSSSSFNIKDAFKMGCGTLCSSEVADPNLSHCFNNFDYIVRSAVREKRLYWDFVKVVLYLATILMIYLAVVLCPSRFGASKVLVLFRKNLILWSHRKMKTILTILVPCLITMVLAAVFSMVSSGPVIDGKEMFMDYLTSSGEQNSSITNMFDQFNESFNGTGNDIKDQFNLDFAPLDKINMLQNVLPLIGLFFLIVMIFPFATCLSDLVLEKSVKMKQYLLMTGVSRFSLIFADLMARNILFTLTGLGLAAITKYAGIFTPHGFSDLFFFFIGFQLALYGFALLISVFYEEPKQAIVAGVISLVIIHLTIFAVHNASFPAKLFFSLFVPLTSGLGLFILMKESFAMSIITLRLIRVMQTGRYSLILFTWLLVADFILYVLLFLYLDSVVPQKHGIAKSPLFIFSLKFWKQYLPFVRPKEDESKDISEGSLDDKSDNNDLIEKETLQENTLRRHGKLVETRNLTKRFGENTVVDNLNVKFYEGQVTAFLGHNGAGKSTTFGLVTGSITATSGETLIYGCSIKQQSSQIHDMIGYCPQYNAIYDTLTVRQNLELFGALKGIDQKTLNKRILTLCEDMNILDKLDYPSAKLSGGQKRKLCIALSFVGNTKFVILDEPTAGMDPYSRKQTWHLIKKHKENRTILFTSHFLDEVDFLSDRIVMITKGQLYAAGTAMFLKSKLSKGYQLSFSLQNHSPENEQRVTTLITKEISNAIKETQIQNARVIKYFLPVQDLALYGGLLKKLDSSSDLGINNLSIEPPTLEDVFLNVASASHSNSKAEKDFEGNQFEKIMNLMEHREKRITSTQHLKAMLFKRFAIAKGNIKLFLALILLPLVFLVIPIIIPTVNIMNLLKKGTGQNGVIEFQLCHQNVVNNNASSCFSNQAHSSNEIEEILNSGSPRCFNPDPEVNFDHCNVLPWVCNFDKCSDPKDEISPFYTCAKTNPGNENSFCPSVGLAAVQDMFNALINTFCVFLAFLIIPVLAGGSAVWENETAHNTKFQQLCSGVKNHVYWIGNFIWDFMNLSIVFGMALIVFLAAQVDFPIYTGGTWLTFGLVAVLIFLYILSILPFTYVLSRFFSDHSQAISFFAVLNLFGGIALVMIQYIFTIINAQLSPGFYMVDITAITRYVFNILPAFALSDGILGIISLKGMLLIRDFDIKHPILFEPHMEFDHYNVPEIVYFDRVFLNLIYMIVVTVVSWFILLVWDKRLPNDEPRSKIIPQPVPEYDANVQNERKRIQSLPQREPISIEGLSKKFSTGKIALNDLWLGISGSECFGLLGVNGAGKTTTMQILTGKMKATAGEAYIGNYPISNMEKTRSLIGYCPQFDALFDNVSVTDHLKLYALIKGINHPEIIDFWIESMNLASFKDTAAGNLSGGNKRKLSVAMAMMGGPLVAYLDEPSTGLDAYSKRFLWGRIRDIIRDFSCSVILTTHSMEECEALCSKVGILVDGRLKALGAIPEIKEKYGKKVCIEVGFGEKFSTKRLLADLTLFTQGPVSTLESQENRTVFSIESNTANLADLFQWMQENQKEHNIKSYSVRTENLEEIFNSFASMQNSLT